MSKNYYKILEIDKDASPEIIKKAYNTLVKKYHPDLQENSSKAEYEAKLKLINEAYEVLSDKDKRAQYDVDLSNLEDQNNKFNEDLLNENRNLKEELQHLKRSNNINSSRVDEPIFNYTKPSSSSYENENITYENELKYQQELQQAREQAYYDAYIQDLKNRGYKIKYKKTWKDYLKSFFSILCSFLVFFLLWQIPFFREPFINMYNENKILHSLIDALLNLFK